ncbi:MAG: hypothetical protein H6621_08580 [Halobacteriovoraceae bacterium]|nr:hypothetical protein [Halobacteriovoraceae bacterium]
MIALLFTLIANCKSDKKYTSLYSVTPTGSTGTIGPGDDTKGVARFEAFQKVIANNCVTCHINIPAAPAAARSIDFNALKTEEDWVSSSYVVANSPEDSSVFYTLKGAGVIDAFNESMPEGGTLTQAELNAVRDWVLYVDISNPDDGGGGPTGNSRCGTPDPAGVETRFNAAMSIINSRCISCHPGQASSDFRFASNDEAKASAYVTAGNLFGSPIYYRMKGSDDVRPGQNRDMPQGGAAPSQADLDTIKDWICKMPD